MAQAIVPIRLLSRRNLAAGDVESVYAELVKAIGGTYFSAGISTGPVNGTLDWRNFSYDAGISNNYKSSPNSLFCVEMFDTFNGAWSGYTTPTTLTVPIPIGPNDVGPFTLTEWGFSYLMHSSPVPTAATWALSTVRNGTPTAVTTLTQANINTGTGTGDVFAVSTGLSVAINPGDSLSMTATITTAGAGDVFYFKVHVYFKAPHIR